MPTFRLRAAKATAVTPTQIQTQGSNGSIITAHEGSLSVYTVIVPLEKVPCEKVIRKKFPRKSYPEKIPLKYFPYEKVPLRKSTPRKVLRVFYLNTQNEPNIYLSKSKKIIILMSTFPGGKYFRETFSRELFPSRTLFQGNFSGELVHREIFQRELIHFP